MLTDTSRSREGSVAEGRRTEGGFEERLFDSVGCFKHLYDVISSTIGVFAMIRDGRLWASCLVDLLLSIGANMKDAWMYQDSDVTLIEKGIFVFQGLLKKMSKRLIWINALN